VSRLVEIRTHGRGGQGAVIASKVLANALFKEGRFVQAFPAFGVERRGAPVVSFTRFDEAPIRLRCEIYKPDHLIVLDEALTKTIDITSGLKNGGWIIINTSRNLDQFDYRNKFKLAVVDANEIAWRHRLGSRAQPIVNTAILGAFARATGLVGLDAVVEAVGESVPMKPEENQRAAVDAFNETKTADSVSV
jgi:2-oxoacid:acceptor oxidoreductase gamma subunit (pyruvate/2-ketoisovalerate family)